MLLVSPVGLLSARSILPRSIMLPVVWLGRPSLPKPLCCCQQLQRYEPPLLVLVVAVLSLSTLLLVSALATLVCGSRGSLSFAQVSTCHHDMLLHNSSLSRLFWLALLRPPAHSFKHVPSRLYCRLFARFVKRSSPVIGRKFESWFPHTSMHLELRTQLRCLM